MSDTEKFLEVNWDFIETSVSKEGTALQRICCRKCKEEQWSRISNETPTCRKCFNQGAISKEAQKSARKVVDYSARFLQIVRLEDKIRSLTGWTLGEAMLWLERHCGYDPVNLRVVQRTDSTALVEPIVFNAPVELRIKRESRLPPNQGQSYLTAFRLVNGG